MIIQALSEILSSGDVDDGSRVYLGHGEAFGSSAEGLAYSSGSDGLKEKCALVLRKTRSFYLL